MEICTKSKLLGIILSTFFIYGCTSIDLSTPEKSVESFYYAVSQKDAKLYAKCFYEHGEFTCSQLRLAAQHIFAHIKILRFKIVQKETVSPNEVKLTIEEVLQRDNELKFVSTFIVTYIKVGKEWKILRTKDIETRKIE